LQWRAPHICSAIKEVLNPESVLDVGCATGDLVKGFLDLGVDAYGLDKYVTPEEMVMPESRLYRMDVCEWMGMDNMGPERKFDLVTCIEVLGVVRKTGKLLGNLVAWSNTILLSAAPEIKEAEEGFLYGIGFRRAKDAENKIRLPLEPYKHKLAIKAFYNGMAIWRK